VQEGVVLLAPGEAQVLRAQLLLRSGEAVCVGLTRHTNEKDLLGGPCSDALVAQDGDDGLREQALLHLNGFIHP